ncbi:MAG: FHA domain-containing protein [Planctomycetota bacterium]|nr:FHA domain-containing protein [Planctomycetota bacterium]
MAYLTVRTKGEDGHDYFDLTQTEVVLGRQEDCEFRVDSDRLSRRHCVFTREDNNWFLEDLDSANGTRVGTEKISEKVPLNERDVVKAGKLRMTFHRGSRSQRKAKKDAKAIDLDGDDLGGTSTAPTREPGINDPPEAIPCEHCHTWFSIAHRLPGDSMACPQCNKSCTVPQLVS